MQSPEPQITDNSFMQFAAILVATLATETLQTLTWTLTGGCHILSAPYSRAQLQLVSLHRQVQHTLTNTGMESSVQLSIQKKCHYRVSRVTAAFTKYFRTCFQNLIRLHYPWKQGIRCAMGKTGKN